MKIKIFSTTWCPDCLRSKAYLDKNNIAYEVIDIEKQPEFVELVQELNGGNQTVPTIVITYDDGSEKILAEPHNDVLQSAIDLKSNK
ncbi:MAG: glutaredoxin domain-containing protein [bacterium]